MAIELPKAAKVYTTTYDNLKGVDFTNDSTNVWRRRSPDAVNMLPDESGRPFKRHGWNILLSNEQLCTALSVDTCTIQKCAYFELAGVDHIVVFTDAGVLFYNGDENATSYTTIGVTAICTDPDCYSGYDRCFFFEGNGISAFYIYGNYKVWRYESDFTLHDVTAQITVPTVLISTSADCVGTLYDGYNLLGTVASIEYNSTDLYTYWCSDGLTIVVPSDLKSSLTVGKIYRYTWVESTEQWIDTNLTGVSFASTGISVIGTPNDDDEIIVLYMNGVMLPNNVSDRTKVSVWASTNTQFDTPLEVLNTGTPSSGEVRLWTDDTIHRENGKAWLEFGDQWQWDSGEDFIKVNFPSVEINMTQFTNEDSTTTTANLVGA